jgi:hypothetical protein
MEIFFAHFSFARVSLVQKDLLEHFYAVVIKLLLVQIVGKLLFKVRIQF